MLGSFGEENTTFGDTDFGWYGILLSNAAKLGTVWGVVTMLLIGAVLLVAAVAVQRRLVDTDWDPSGGRPRTPTVGGDPAASGDVPPAANGDVPAAGRAYPRIAPPRGAPTPPPPPSPPPPSS